MRRNFALVLLGLLTFGLAGCGTKMGYYPDVDKYIAGSTEYPDVEVKTIDIDWLSGSVTLVEDESATEITISEVTGLTEKEALVHSYCHDGILSIKYFASGYWCRSFNYKKELTITYRPGLYSLSVDLTSGSLKATTVHAKEFNLDLTSGSANITDLVTEKATNNLTSGNVSFAKVNAEKFDMNMTSGSANIGYESIEKSSLHLTSGKVDMTLPEEGGTVKISKTSGSVKTNREGTFSNDTYKFGNGKAEIDVSMTSGTVTIA
ncbi:MAG: DUF4097 family beta strand repeat protein [Bacilli bacterium]|nr:DUF4097 family beta strand repeat protein [Bacilli bacterium]